MKKNILLLIAGISLLGGICLLNSSHKQKPSTVGSPQATLNVRFTFRNLTGSIQTTDGKTMFPSFNLSSPNVSNHNNVSTGNIDKGDYQWYANGMEIGYYNHLLVQSTSSKETLDSTSDPLTDHFGFVFRTPHDVAYTIDGDHLFQSFVIPFTVTQNVGTAGGIIVSFQTPFLPSKP